MENKTVKLGDKGKDIVTGFQGIVMAKTEYITGCDHVALLSQTAKDKDGAPTDWIWFDITRIKLVKKSAINLDRLNTRKPGGPAPEAPSR